MTPPWMLIFAFLLDLALGDPRWLPHPVRIIGKAIQRSESFLRKHYRTPPEEKKAGVLLVVMIVIPTLVITFAIQEAIFRASARTSPILGIVLLVYLVATTIAVRGLTDAARVVIRSVKKGQLVLARRDLGMIVGRDTENMTGKEVLKAVMETLAENLSDGIIAPVFFYVLGGLPFAMAYKAVNTLDSMVGYKNATYINFGWAAARLDDIANFIPARITGIVIVLSAFVTVIFKRGTSAVGAACRSFETMLRDGRNHMSPNSGVPEAAMAGALGVRMGGPSTYGGILVEKPYIGEDARDDYLAASCDAMRIAYVTSVIGVGIAAIVLASGSVL
jgi:adenosylcobinamide-phosphate synthase